MDFLRNLFNRKPPPPAVSPANGAVKEADKGLVGTAWVGTSEWAGASTTYTPVLRMKIEFAEGGKAIKYTLLSQTYVRDGSQVTWKQTGEAVYVGTYYGASIAWEFNGTVLGDQLVGTEVELGSNDRRKWDWNLTRA